MYPILEYSSKYLILEYYAYFHTYTLYIYPVFVQTMYMYILTVTVYTILLVTVLLTQSVLVFTCSAAVRINVITICIVNTLLVCVSVRFTDT